jgi:hypothetical protein
MSIRDPGAAFQAISMAESVTHRRHAANTRDMTVADAEEPEPGEHPGDLGPEAARFVPADESPNGRPLLIVSNEVSGSLRVFEVVPRQ